MDAGQPLGRGVVGKRNIITAFLFDALEFLHHQLLVKDGQDGGRDEATGVFATPLVDMPIVVGLNNGVGILRVFGFDKQGTFKAHKRTKAQRAQNAIGVHIIDTRVNIVTAFAHLRESGGFTAVLVLTSADHGIKADIGQLVAFELPEFRAVIPFNQGWRLFKLCRSHVVLEQIRWLHHMIIDTYHNHIFHTHAGFPLVV